MENKQIPEEVLKLNSKEETSYTVNYYELEEAIRVLFNVDVSFIEEFEASNDNVYRIRVSPELSSCEQVEIKTHFLRETQKDNGISFPSICTIMKYMCSMGYIKPGIYIVSICW